MKYLIDGATKQALSLAHQYKYLKSDDEFRIYDLGACTIDNKDVLVCTDYVLKDGLLVVDDQTDEDTRRFKFVTDFESNLEWCDCYVNFQKILELLGSSANIDETNLYMEEMIARMDKAKELGKYIYLGHCFDEDFEDTIKNYDKCLNKMIGQTELNEMLEYRGDNFSTYGIGSTEVDVTMVTGTNGASGKFSCSMQIKEYYENLGEKVVLIMTEETAPFLDNSKNDIYTFCRNYSELTTDEDFLYFQGLFCKIISEQGPDRIIVVTQSGIGVNGIEDCYFNTKTSNKMKNVYDLLLERSFGVNTVVIAGNYNRTLEIEKQVAYFNLLGCGLSTIFVSPVAYNEEDLIIYPNEQESTEIFYKVRTKGTSEDVLSACTSLAIKFPNIHIRCNYDNITDKITNFRNSEDYMPLVAKNFATDLIYSTMTMLDRNRNITLLELAEEECNTTETQNDEQLQKALEISSQTVKEIYENSLKG